MGMPAPKAPESNNLDLFVVVILEIQGMYLPPAQNFARRARFIGEKNNNFGFFTKGLIVVRVYAEV